MILCLGVMAFSGYKIVEEQRAYRVGANSYEKIISEVVGETSSAIEGISLPEREIDFSELLRINREGNAWIYCPGTIIDYPVAQGSDNAYYLDRTFDGRANKVGSIFLDYRNDPNYQDKNSVLYGHHMRNGSMFASIVGYKKQSYYDAHPVFYLYTKEQTYIVELFAGFVKDASDTKLSFQDEEEFLAYVEELKERSTFQANVQVNPEDRILTMSTCAYDFKNARYVLVGKLTACGQ